MLKTAFLLAREFFDGPFGKIIYGTLTIIGGYLASELDTLGIIPKYGTEIAIVIYGAFFFIAIYFLISFFMAIYLSIEKIMNYFKIKVEPYPQPQKGGDVWASLQVINGRGVDILNCHGILKNVYVIWPDGTKVPYTEQVNINNALLAWSLPSNNGYQTIRHDDEQLVNVARTKDNRLSFTLHDDFSDNHDLWRPYEIHIEVRGDIGRLSFKRAFRGFIKYEERNAIHKGPIITKYHPISGETLEQNQWEDVRTITKKLLIKRGQYHEYKG